MNLDSARAIIQSSGNEEIMLRIAENIFEFSNKFPKSKYFNIQLIRGLNSEFNNLSDSKILETLIILSEPCADFLEPGFELLNDENEQSALTTEEVSIALTEGIDPLTGDHDPDIKSRMIMFFRPRLAPSSLTSIVDGGTSA